MERDHLERRRQPTLRERTHEVRVHQRTSMGVPRGRDVPGSQSFQERLSCISGPTNRTAQDRHDVLGLDSSDARD